MIRTKTIPRIAPDDNGRLMTPEVFDLIEDYEEGWRYELIQGVLVVNPIPRKPSRGMAVKLMHMLENYGDKFGKDIEFFTVLFEEEIRLPNGNRRRCDVAIWLELGRNPQPDDVPTITVEFVSKRKADVKRDYVDKRADYLEAGISEYWIIDRFQRTMTALKNRRGRWQERRLSEGDKYTTPFLPGFELNIAELFTRADAISEGD